MSVTEQLAKLGITIPAPATPAGSYVAAVRTGDLIFTAGQVPYVDGKLPATGRVGVDVTPERAQELARISAINALAAVSNLVDLDEVVRVVKVVGFVASAPDFTGQSGVVNGASDFFVEVFGDAGKHARSAVGMASLPLGAPVEIEIVVEVRPGA